MNVLKHLDLASVFKKDKPAAPTPEVIGVITMKSDGFDSVKAQISEAGFSVEKEEIMADGSVVFGQSGDMTGEHVLIRLSENAVMAVKSFNPYNIGMSLTDGTTFAEVCKVQGFYPGVGTMVDVLRAGVLQLAEKSEDPQAASIQVGKMFDEAKQYAITMVGGLPSKAFKLESVAPVAVEAAKADEGKTEATEATEATDEGTDVTKSAKPNPFAKPADAAKDPMDDEAAEGEADPAKGKKPAKAKKEDGTDDTAGAEESTDAPAAAPALTVEQVSELVNKQIESFTTKMEALIGGVSKAVEGVGASVQTLSTRVDAAEGVAKAASEAVSGTVVLGSDGGDPAQVVKTEARSFGREIDTAYMPRSQRNTAGRR